jgi:ABC-type phosphate transport system permease subunit
MTQVSVTLREPNRTATRMTIAFLVAAGLAGVSIALGLLYFDFNAQQQARHEILLRGQALSQQQQDQLLEAWNSQKYGVPALIFGTLGVALLGAGVAFAAFEWRDASKR